MSNSTSTTAAPPPTSTKAAPPSSTISSPANTPPTPVVTSSANPVITTTTTTTTTTSLTTAPLPPPTTLTTPTTTLLTTTTTSSTTTSVPPVSTPPTIAVTSFITTISSDGQPPVTVIRTSTYTPTQEYTQSSTGSSSSTSTASLAGGANDTSSGGLSGGGKTAVEVIVPIVGVALLVLAGLWFWRRRKQRKDAEEIRRKEMEEYGYNPNEDPTLPAVGGVMKGSPGQDGPAEMVEDEAGYRGWGTTAAGSTGRKASTTLASAPGGMAYSEGTSPSHGPISDARSGDTLVGSPNGRAQSEGSEEVLGAMGPATTGNRSGDMHRGPSNASSSYSAANRSDGSGEAPLPGTAYGAGQYYQGDTNYGGPYADGRAEMSGQPVIRDNLARRATRIENPSHFPTQASAGIAQNF